jgi:dihydrofolate synthase/folylpolyglutamate synthase
MLEFARRAGLSDALGDGGKPRFLHVAGTNGKGSVTAFLQSMLVESGYLTGAYFSPYVFELRERWQMGRELISCESLAALTDELWPFGESLAETEYGGATEFEFKTALALLYFKRMKCEWVALEVGLGGRLDATNIITPAAAAVVTIGLDHVGVLGATLSAIAGEKAGIIKEGRPVVMGRMDEQARQVIHSVACERHAPVWEVGPDIAIEADGPRWRVATPARTYTDICPGIVGQAQPHNAAVALGLMDASGATRSIEANVEGLAKAKLPGRMQRSHLLGHEWILDGAHNAQAGESLRASFAEAGFGRAVLLTGMVSGHDMTAFYESLRGVARDVVVAPIQFHRAAPPEEVAEIVTSLFGFQMVNSPDGEQTTIASTGTVTISETVDEAIRLATQKAGNDPILVTGSFYLVGEVGRLLGLT